MMLPPNFTLKAADTCQDTHLNNPLHNAGLEQAIADSYRDMERNWSFTRKAMQVELLMLSANVPFQPIELAFNPQVLMDHIFTYGCRFSQLYSEHLPLDKHLQVAGQIFDLSAFQFLPSSTMDLVKTFTSIPRMSGVGNTISHLYKLRCHLEQGVIMTARPGSYNIQNDLRVFTKWRAANQGDGFPHDILHTQITDEIDVFLTPRLSVFRWKKRNQIWFGTRDHYLMIADAIGQRWISLLCSVMGNVLKQTNYPTWEQLMGTFKWGDQRIAQLGNSAYDSLKLWEPLITGFLMSKHPDEVVDENSFLHNMETALEELDSDLAFKPHLTWKMLKEQYLHDANDHQLSQLHGLYRIWGHPSIDLRAGLAKLRSVASSERVYSSLAIFHHMVTWREMFCMSFYERHHKWPKMEISPDMPIDSLLRKCLESGTPLAKNSKSYVKDHWAHIRFLQNFSVPKKFQLNDMIKDSATSLGFTELAHHLVSTGSIGPAASRSVIIRWLEKDWNDPEEFLRKIDREGFDKDERVIGLREKEKEMSPLGRFFGMLPIEKRLYVVVTEAMLAEHILPYFPEITMTYNQVKLREVIQKETRKLRVKKEETKTTITNMDFVKWNSNMREEETHHLFQDFDHLFGFEKVFTRSYEMFSQSQMYLANGYIVPEVDLENGRLVDSDIVWSDHKGGIEGLRQKGWTVFTIVALRYIATLQGVACNLMGQGDNQVMVLTYRQKAGVSYKDQHNEFLASVDRFLSMLGPPLKPEETWSSSNFFAYGKFPVLKGEPLSQSIKKIVKTSRMTNEGMQNLGSTLSSITANASAATEADLSPVIPFFMATFEASCAIQLHLDLPFFSNSPLYTERHMKWLRIPVEGAASRRVVEKDWSIIYQIQHTTVNGLSALMLMPSSLGGYPVCHYWSLIVHGFPDPLSMDLQGLRAAYNRTSDHWIKKVINRVLQPHYCPSPNPEMLCQDPTSLNLLHPSTAMDKLKGMVFEFLCNRGPSFIGNTAFLSFLELAKMDQSKLAEILFGANVLHPRVMSSVTDSTLVGKVNQALAKVNKTGVLIDMMKKAKAETLRRCIEDISLEDVPYDARAHLPRQSTRPFSEIFWSFDQNFFNSIIHGLGNSRADSKCSASLYPCSYRNAKRLRFESWGKQLEGVSVPVPWELLKGHPSLTADCALDNHPYNMAGYIITNLIGLEHHLSSLRENQPTSIGPFTSYLGSGTRNKVEYEAKRLVEVAPPVLKSALRLLQLVGWATMPGSSFAKLIFKIVASMTDLDSEMLTPEQSQISGSLGHRWDDIKSSRMCTSSILYTGASFVSSNTNKFRPENLLEDQGSDNLALHFQSMFLWTNHILSVRNLYKGHPLEDQCIHFHIDCPCCIEALNEEKIELSVDPTEFDTLEFLKPQPTNKYLWVPKETLPDLLPAAPSLGEKIDVGEETELEVLQDLLVQATVDDIMTHHGMPSISFHSEFDESRFYQIPLTLLLKIPVVPLFMDLLFEELLRLCWIHLHNFLDSARPNLDSWLAGLKSSLATCPASWFNVFHPLLLSPPQIFTIKQKWPLINAPVGSPPSMTQKSLFFQEIFRTQLRSPDFNASFLSWLAGNTIGRTILAVRHGLPNHPIIKWALAQVFYLHPDTRFQFFIKRVKSLTMKYEDAMVLSNCDLSKLVENIQEENFASMRLIGQFIQESFLRLGHPLCFSKVTHHGVGSLISGRVRLHNLDAPQPHSITDEQFQSLLNGIRRLPESSAVLVELQSDLDTASRKERFTDCQLSLTPSLLNHLAKPTTDVTTAQYKLLSLLQFALSQGLALPNLEDFPVFGVGDGEGGFCSLMSLVWKNLTIVYNSLHDVAEFSAAGSEAFIPASFYNCEGTLARVMGLSLIEEGHSDLTKRKTIEVLLKNFPRGSILLSDCEGSGKDDPRKEQSIRENLILLAIEGKFRMAIIKSYAQSILELYLGINQWASVFRDIRVVRSHFSGIGNSEVYLVMQNRRAFPYTVPSVVWAPDHSTAEISHLITRLPYEDFKTGLLNRVSEFMRSALPSMTPYVHFLISEDGLTEWRFALNAYLQRFGFGGRFSFPMTFYQSIIGRYAPVSLSRSVPATWVPSYFTPSVKAEIMRDFFLAWGLHLIVSEGTLTDWTSFIEDISTYGLLCFQTLSGSWGIQPVYVGKDTWSHLAAAILIKPSDFSLAAKKSLLTNLSRFKFCYQPGRGFPVEQSNIFQAPILRYHPIPRHTHLSDQPFSNFTQAKYLAPWSWRPVTIVDPASAETLAETLAGARFGEGETPFRTRHMFLRFLMRTLPHDKGLLPVEPRGGSPS